MGDKVPIMSESRSIDVAILALLADHRDVAAGLSLGLAFVFGHYACCPSDTKYGPVKPRVYTLETYWSVSNAVMLWTAVRDSGESSDWAGKLPSPLGCACFSFGTSFPPT